MIDWDDIRYFLAVARGGSVRAAAEDLGVNHSTVLRRAAQLEERLGTKLFERLPSGYRLTDAGEDVLALAEQMDASSNQLEARIIGRDQSLRGSLRVTMASAFATHLLMPDFATFASRHPDIALDVHTSDAPVNLTNRQADVAVRVVYDRASLPRNLHGWIGPPVFGCVYMSREVLANWHADPRAPVRWILKEAHGIPEWAAAGSVPVAAVPFRTEDLGGQIAALHAGVGMTALPCFVGDPDPALARVPGVPPHMHGTVWLLTQGETRRSRRVRLFREFMSRRLAAYAPLLAGRRHTAG